MSIGAVFVGLALLFLAVPFVASPFLSKRRLGTEEQEFRLVPEQTRRRDGKREWETEERREVFIALRDLEFDHQTGKIVDEDFEQLRAQLLVEAANIIQEEQEAKASASAQEDKLEALIRARREVKSQAAFCPQCGRRLQVGDKFCSVCGKMVVT